MAKPRIFISSTFYDLRQVRIDLNRFLDSLGYEAVRNEEGGIPYGKDEALEDYCYKEISNVDILVSIIGSRYGSEAEGKEHYSISQKELKTAIDNGKQVFIFIEKNVASEYETFLINRENDKVKYKYVDNVNIYRFIEEIRSLPNNNSIKEFETSEDIIKFLREQFAGLFKQFIDQEQRNKEAFVIKDIENTAKTLRELVDYMKSQSDDKDVVINEILKINHPLVLKLKTGLSIPYNFYIEGKKDLKSILNARSAYYDKALGLWRKKEDDNRFLQIYISDELFDENDRLKEMKASEWRDDMCRFEKVSLLEDDVPF